MVLPYNLIPYLLLILLKISFSRAVETADELHDGGFLRDVAFVSNGAAKSRTSLTGMGHISILPGIITVVTQFSGITVTNCTKDTLHVEGWRSWTLIPGKILIYTGGADAASCQDCAPLFRRITAVPEEKEGFFSRVVHTEFVAIQDFVSKMPNDQDSHGKSAWDDEDDKLMSRAVEPLFDCQHSGGKQRGMLELSPGSPPDDFPQACEPGKIADSDWFQIDGNSGQCRHANCCLGDNATKPTQCFHCNINCFNGCGTASIDLNGDFRHFSFVRACCNHDHCYHSTVYARKRCDHEFYHQMNADCPTGILSLPSWKLCKLFALVAYAIVTVFGPFNYETDQRRQMNHENSPVCMQCMP